MGMKLNIVICYEWKFWFKTWLSGWGQGCRRCHAMSRPTGSNVEICLGNFAVGVVGKLRIETSSFVFCPRLMEVDPSRVARRLQPLPPQLPIPTNLKKWHQKTYFQTKFVLKGYKWGLSICAVSPQSSHKDRKKSRNFPKFVKHSSATPWRSRLNRVKSTSVFFMTSTSNPQVQYSLSTAVSVSICVHFILCFSVFRFDENVPYLAFHIPPSKSQCLICGKIFSVWRFL